MTYPLSGHAGIQMLILLALSAICAATVNAVRPDPLPWVDDWSHRVERQALRLGLRVAGVDQAKALIDEGQFLVFDARPEADYRQGHLPSALPLPEPSFDEMMMSYAGLLFPDQGLLVYCSGAACDESLAVSRRLLDMGYTNVVLFAEGFAAWIKAGHPIESSR
jgi:rhodanese-related sulfurtransferase